MKLNRQLTISAFDLLLGGVAPNAEHFVVIPFLRGGHMAISRM